MPKTTGPAAGEVSVTTIRKHAGQQSAVLDAGRFNVLSCGRRWGKTSLQEDLIIRAAVAGDPTAWMAPEYQMLDEPMRDLMARLAPIIVSSNLRERRIELAGGGTIDFFSLDNPKGIRGRKFKRVIVDEAAYVKNLIQSWNFVIRPTLADLVGDAWFGSTPNGMNDFHTLHARGGVVDGWKSFTMPTESNPHVPPTEIVAMRSDMGDLAARQEIDAQFLDLTGAVFRNIRVCATERPVDGPSPDGTYVAGIDLASTTDWTVIKVLDISGAIPREVYSERWTRVVDWELQLGRLSAVMERFTPVMTVVDRTSHGDKPFQDLVGRMSGFPMKGISFTHATKSAMVQALALAFERSEIRILDDPATVGELISFEAKKTPTGLMTYGAPSGGHDDLVSALYLAFHAYGGGRAASGMGPSQIAKLVRELPAGAQSDALKAVHKTAAFKRAKRALSGGLASVYGEVPIVR